jgi:hypothetical protein
MHRLRPLAFAATVTLVTTFAASAAIAQPSAPDASGAEDLEIETTVDQGVLDDASADRAWLAPTAHTQPKGSWSFSDHELFVVGLGYGVTDKLQVSASTVIPLDSDMAFVGMFSAKQQVFKQGRVRIAAHGVLTHVNDNDDSGTGITAGAAGTICLDEECHSGINGYVGTAFALTDEGNQYPVLLSVSVVQKLNKHVKLVGEVDTGFVPGEDFEDVYLGWYGVRFTSGAIGANIGLVKPFGPSVDTEDALPLGLPWVNFTYRAL